MHWSVRLGWVPGASDVSGFLYISAGLFNPQDTRFYKGIFSHENLPQTAWSSRVDSLPESLISPPGVVKPSTTHTHLSHHSPQRGTPQASRAEAGRGAGGSGLYIPRACAESREHTAHTPRTGTHEHACAPAPPPVAGSPKLPPRLPRRRAHAALQAPTSFPPWSARSQSLRLGKTPEPASPRLLSSTPGSALAAAPRGLGRPWPRPPGSGSALTCAAPTGLQPGPAHRGGGGRSGFSRAASGRHRLSWRSGWLRLRDAASPPGRPQPRSLCLGRRRRVTGWRAVSCAGREALGGKELGSASPSSPARGALAGRAHWRRLRAPGGRRGRVREGRGGRAEGLPGWKLRPGRAGWGPRQSSEKATSAGSRVAAAALGKSERRLRAGGSPAVRATAGIRVSPLPYAEGDCGPQRPSRGGERRPRLASSPGALGSPFPGLRFRNPLQDQGTVVTSLIDFPSWLVWA